ncbi:hypothetical protein ACLOJK_016004 [Asimina triloba]
MSGDLKGGIPNGVRKVIQNIKEIASNHTEDEIYAMLKECSMDPNETAQKLLYQDTFHEVKRKRDRRKESIGNKEAAETTRWRPGMQGRGVRGGRGSYSAHYISSGTHLRLAPCLFGSDTSSGRNTSSGKENGLNQYTDVGITSTSPGSLDAENKATIPVTSSMTGTANDPADGMHGSSTDGSTSVVPEGSAVLAPKETSASDSKKTWDVQLSSADMKSSPASVVGGEQGQPMPNTKHFQLSMAPISISGVYSSASDPVLVPCSDSRTPGAIGTIKREVGSQRTVVGQTVTMATESMPVSQDSTYTLQIDKRLSCDSSDPESSLAISEKAPSEMGNAMHGRTQGAEKDLLSEATQTASLGASDALGSRPSSDYSNHKQPLTASQKVAPSKEWKPKSVNPNVIQASTSSTSEIPTTVEASGQSQHASHSSASASEETASKLQKNLEELHLSSSQHVIIPKHLRVPEAERTGLSFGSFGSFGSFDAGFVLGTGVTNGPDSDKISTPLSESSQGIEEDVEEPSSSLPDTSPATQEGDYPDHLCSPKQVQDNLSPGEDDIPSSISPTPDYDQSKPERPLSSGGPQYTVVHTTPNYSTFGLMQTVVSNQLAPTEGSEPQARDTSHLPSIIVQQPFDPSTNYYTQFFRPGADGDGRFSPFLAPGTSSKYNGNIGVLPSQTGQSSPESSERDGGSLVDGDLTTFVGLPTKRDNSVGLTMQATHAKRQWQRAVRSSASVSTMQLSGLGILEYLTKLSKNWSVCGATSGSSLVLSTASSTLLTQAAGVMQSSISATQQPLPIFRQPAGLPISHYPHNYLPYNQYFSPYYGPPPAIHPFLGNAAFPQQSPAGGLFLPPGVGPATAIKYPLPQYKAGTNTGNSTHIGVQSGFGPFSSSPSATTGSSSNNEDLAAAPQYKETNLYITGQQSEGSPVWIPAAGRDIAGLQASTFYNLSPQGQQHLAFAPAQAGHSTFPGIYHPAQTVPAATAHPLLQQPQTMGGPVEIGPSPTGVYQQPQQRPQINWANSGEKTSLQILHFAASTVKLDGSSAFDGLAENFCRLVLYGPAKWQVATFSLLTMSLEEPDITALHIKE